MEKNFTQTINQFIQNALREDVGEGDHTSMACIPSGCIGKVSIISKEKGVIAGVELACLIIKRVDSKAKVKCFVHDGDDVSPGKKIMVLTSHVRNLLKTERIILNCMQRMSGIATLTRNIVKKLQGTKTKLLDTRKTTSTLRWMEKWAVRIGGGHNHRFGLYDMLMLKENHIHFAGGIENSINKVNDYLKENKKKLKIEIEARNLNDVKKIIRIGGVDRILLDNMLVPVLKKAMKLIKNRFETEASGNINFKNARKIAMTGVNFVSCGAITHSYKSLDLTMLAEEGYVGIKV